MATIEATWETWSPWGTNYCKEQDARTKAQTGGQWAKESWGTASAHLLEDMIGYKEKEGDFFIVESPAHSHLTKCSWGKHQQTGTWTSRVPWCDDTLNGTHHWASLKIQNLIPLVKRFYASPERLSSFCRQEETGKNETPKGTVGESWVGSHDGKRWRTEKNSIMAYRLINNMCES